MPGGTAKAAPSRSAVAGCLQSIFTALHPELVSFVRKPNVNTSASERSKSARKKRNNNKKLDFVSCMKLMETHWFDYFGHCAYPYDELRRILQPLMKLRHDVAHQNEVAGDDLNNAIEDLTRLSVLIHASRATRDDIRSSIATMTGSSPLPVVDAYSSLPNAQRTEYHLQPGVAQVLFPKLKMLVCCAIEREQYLVSPVKMAPGNSKTGVSRRANENCLPNALFDGRMEYLVMHWTNFKIVHEYPELREVAKRVRRYYPANIALGIEDFNDAVDAFFCLAVLVGASRSELSRLREELQKTQSLHVQHRPSETVKQPNIKPDFRYSAKQPKTKPDFRYSDSVKQPASEPDFRCSGRVPDLRDIAYCSSEPVVRKSVKQMSGKVWSCLCTSCEAVFMVLAGVVFVIGYAAWNILVFLGHGLVFLGTGLVVVGQSFFVLVGILSYIALGLLCVALGVLLVYVAVKGFEFLLSNGSSLVEGVEKTIDGVKETIHNPWV